MTTFQNEETVPNRYRRKCPANLTLTQRYDPYQRPALYNRYPEYYNVPIVPTPPCPAPDTWANTFTYDDYSTKVWANDMNHQQRMSLQCILLQRDILMQESGLQYPSCSFNQNVSSPRGNNIALSIMNEESGYLGVGEVSGVTPDGDILDDVLDREDNCSTDDLQVTRTYDTSIAVPDVDSPVVYTKPELPKQLQTKAKTSKTEDFKRHVCTICNKTFSWRTGLITHQRIHKGDRPYKCSQCPKSFSDYSTYAKHSRIHSGSKPYTCEHCGKCFTQSGNRLRHMRTVHKLSV